MIRLLETVKTLFKPKNKVIVRPKLLLDIDGVLNHNAFYERMRDEGWVHKDYVAIDSEKVKLINKICDDTGAEVVISSTWRTDGDNQYFQDMFNTLGGTFKVVGRTGHCCSGISSKIHLYII